jgi:predicted Rossmann fold flavoprotein
MVKTDNPADPAENLSDHKEYDMAIIGAGPAGIMAAISAASGQSSGKISICLLERNESAAKKLLLTGNGRCNYTADIDSNGMLSAFGKKGRFFSEAFNEFSNRDLIDFFRAEGIEPEYEKSCENETLTKVFPKNKNASSVRQCLIEKLQKNKIHVFYGFRAEKVLDVKTSATASEKYNFEIQALNNCKFVVLAKKIIIATGGRTYPKTGSTGDGYEIAKKLGHSINELSPYLVPVFSKDRDITLLSGISVKGVVLKIFAGEKVIAKNTGSILFTHRGLSGPCAAGIGHVVYKLLNNKNKNSFSANGSMPFNEYNPILDFFKASIDLAPDLSFEDFRREISRVYKSNPKKELLTILNMVLKSIPERLLGLLLTRSKIIKNLKTGNLSTVELAGIYNTIKNLEFNIDNNLYFDEAVVTEGGIPVKEINPRDLQSVITRGLYFAGEIIELAGPEGGFNLQKAFSTGWLAGKSAAESLNLEIS